MNFHYLTVRREEPLQVITDKKDISALQHAAFTDPTVFTYNVDEEQLLYLSWGNKEYSQEQVERIYHKAMEDEALRKEKMKGLLVLQHVEDYSALNDSTSLDKSTWEKYNTFKELLVAHWNDLSLPEQEQIGMAIDDGLTEEQLRMLMLLNLAEMQNMRMAFLRANQM